MSRVVRGRALSQLCDVSRRGAGIVTCCYIAGRRGRYTAFVDAALALCVLRPKQVMLQRPGSGQRPHDIVARCVTRRGLVHSAAVYSNLYSQERDCHVYPYCVSVSLFTQIPSGFPSCRVAE